jgi:diacylglycerol O-acyltransferase
MVRTCPYVPLAAPLRVGVAIFSYDGELVFGVTGDYDCAPDIDVLVDGISNGLTELLPTNGHRTDGARRKRAKRPAAPAAQSSRGKRKPSATGGGADGR